MTCRRLFSLLCFLACLLMLSGKYCFAAEDTTSDAALLWRDVVQARAKLRCFSASWETRIHTKLAAETKILEGATYQITFHADYDRNFFRLTKQANVPAAPELSIFSAYCINDVSLKIIDSLDLTGKEDCHLERWMEYLTPRINHVDPRLLGVYPIEPSLLRNYTFTDLASLPTECQEFKILKSLPESNAVIIRRVRKSRLNGKQNRIDFTIDMGSMCPTLIRTYAETPSGGTLEIVIETKWREIDARSNQNLYAPSHCDAKRYESGQLVYHQSLSDIRFEILPQIPTELFAWQSFPIPDDFLLKKDCENQNGFYKIASNGALVSHSPQPLNQPKPVDIAAGTKKKISMTYTLVILNLVLLVLGVIWALTRRSTHP